MDTFNPNKIAEDVKRNNGKPITMQVYFLQGIFGELPDCNGIAEEVIDSDEKLKKYGIDPEIGGTYIKLIGCSYLYKGDPAQARVFGMEQAKSNISTLPRDIIGRSFLYSTALVLRLIFTPKKFINDLHIFFNEIKHKTIRHVTPPEIRLSIFTREIRRAMNEALKKVFKIDPELNLFHDTDPESVKYSALDLAGLILKMVAFGTLIMEMDGAYRFPAQDALGEINKDNAEKNGHKEFLRIIDLMIERNINLTPVPGVSDRTEGVPNKFRFIKKVLQVIFFFSPRTRKIVKEFLLELDVRKVGLDDADWYFCLRRNTHNYRGISLPDRLQELERIDKERQHQYVRIEFKKVGEDTKVTASLDPIKK